MTAPGTPSATVTGPGTHAEPTTPVTDDAAPTFSQRTQATFEVWLRWGTSRSADDLGIRYSVFRTRLIGMDGRVGAYMVDLPKDVTERDMLAMLTVGDLGAFLHDKLTSLYETFRGPKAPGPVEFEWERTCIHFDADGVLKALYLPFGANFAPGLADSDPAFLEQPLRIVFRDDQTTMPSDWDMYGTLTVKVLHDPVLILDRVNPDFDA